MQTSNMLVLKIMPRSEWLDAQAVGRFEGSEVDRHDGFIHFSSLSQAAETAAKHFANQQDLVVIAFRADDLGPNLKWEPSRGGDLFPHLYGNLDTELAVWTEPLPLDRAGVPVMPDRIREC